MAAIRMPPAMHVSHDADCVQPIDLLLNLSRLCLWTWPRQDWTDDLSASDQVAKIVGPLCCTHFACRSTTALRYEAVAHVRMHDALLRVCHPQNKMGRINREGAELDKSVIIQSRTKSHSCEKRRIPTCVRLYLWPSTVVWWPLSLM